MMAEHDYYTVPKLRPGEVEKAGDAAQHIELVREEMLAAAEALEFERAAELRDRLRALEGAAKDVHGVYAGGQGSAAYGGTQAKSAPKRGGRRGSYSSRRR